MATDYSRQSDVVCVEQTGSTGLKTIHLSEPPPPPPQPPSPNTLYNIYNTHPLTDGTDAFSVQWDSAELCTSHMKRKKKKFSIKFAAIQRKKNFSLGSLKNKTSPTTDTQSPRGG